MPRVKKSLSELIVEQVPSKKLKATRKAKVDDNKPRRGAVRARVKVEEMENKAVRVRASMDMYGVANITADPLFLDITYVLRDIRNRIVGQPSYAEAQLLDSLMSAVANYLEGLGTYTLSARTGSGFMTYARGSLYESIGWLHCLDILDHMSKLERAISRIDEFVLNFYTEEVEYLNKKAEIEENFEKT